LTMKSIIQSTINTHKETFIVNHIEEEMQELKKPITNNFDEYITIVNKCYDTLYQIESITLSPKTQVTLETSSRRITGTISYNIFWTYIQMTVTNYIESITKMNVNVVRGRDFIDFKDFEILHSNMQQYYLNFDNLREVLCRIRDYPESFMNDKQEKLVAKLLLIYDQLSIPDPKNQVHIQPSNLITYLEIIYAYSPDKFDCYAEKFLGFSCVSTKNKYLLEQEKEIIKLIEYISLHNNSSRVFVQQICTLIINKQIQLQSTIKSFEQYFCYLIKLKRLIRKAIKKSSEKHSYHLNVLYEVIKKSISINLGSNSITNIYKPEVDYQKVNSVMSISKKDSKVNIDFEKQILNVIYQKNE